MEKYQLMASLASKILLNSEIRRHSSMPLFTISSHHQHHVSIMQLLLVAWFRVFDVSIAGSFFFFSSSSLALLEGDGAVSFCFTCPIPYNHRTLFSSYLSPLHFKTSFSKSFTPGQKTESKISASSS